MYFFLYYIVDYRKDICRTNLKNAFPLKTEEEITQILKVYYLHLCDLFVEAVKMFGLSKKQLRRYYKFSNPELVYKYMRDNKKVVLMSSHYNNWEYMVLAVGLEFVHGVGVGKRLSDKSLDSFINKYRSRFGSEIVFADNVRDIVDAYDKDNLSVAYMFLSDQSPNSKTKAYWTMFLNMETGFIFGPEFFARKYDYVVLYYDVKKVKRGYYEVTFKEICTNPKEAAKGSIIKTYVGMLEETIKNDPAYWLWSHKRWKHERPEGIELE